MTKYPEGACSYPDTDVGLLYDSLTQFMYRQNWSGFGVVSLRNYVKSFQTYDYWWLVWYSPTRRVAHHNKGPSWLLFAIFVIQLFCPVSLN